MKDSKMISETLDIPKGFILFISGVPGVGKTTTSYELLKQFSNFRIIEETDILRDALRGYNDLLIETGGKPLRDMLNSMTIHDHTKLLSLSDAKEQCTIMRKPLENIVARQQRKGISSIINGVHIVPEVLKDLSDNPRVLFVNLFINSEEVLNDRLTKRDPLSYMVQHVPFIFQSNLDLFNSTKRMVNLYGNSFCNIDVTEQNVDATLREIIICISKKLS